MARSLSRWLIPVTWEKGKKVPGRDPAQWRKDALGVLISRTSYGKWNKYGWECDHIKPWKHGGRDDPSNLRPLNIMANRTKGSKWKGKR